LLVVLLRLCPHVQRAGFTILYACVGMIRPTLRGVLDWVVLVVAAHVIIDRTLVKRSLPSTLEIAVETTTVATWSVWAILLACGTETYMSARVPMTGPTQGG
jgi:hypothetical protein